MDVHWQSRSNSQPRSPTGAIHRFRSLNGPRLSSSQKIESITARAANLLAEPAVALLFAALQGLERFLDQLTPQFLFRVGGNTAGADDMNDAVAKHDSVGADHLSDGNRRSDLNGRNPRLLQFGRDRSAAARAGPSR